MKGAIGEEPLAGLTGVYVLNAARAGPERCPEFGAWARALLGEPVGAFDGMREGDAAPDAYWRDHCHGETAQVTTTLPRA